MDPGVLVFTQGWHIGEILPITDIASSRMLWVSCKVFYPGNHYMTVQSKDVGPYSDHIPHAKDIIFLLAGPTALECILTMSTGHGPSPPTGSALV